MVNIQSSWYPMMICCGFFLLKFSFLLTCLHWFYSTISLSFHQLVKNFSSFLSSTGSSAYLIVTINLPLIWSLPFLPVPPWLPILQRDWTRWMWKILLSCALPCLSSVLVSPCLNSLSFLLEINLLSLQSKTIEYFLYFNPEYFNPEYFHEFLPIHLVKSFLPVNKADTQLFFDCKSSLWNYT